MMVLVVDDDADVRNLLTDVLDLGGYSVETAEHGAIALEKVRRERPDLVLLDLMMPVMDGWTFLRQCQQEEACRDVPVVILSAASSVRGQSAVDVGADGLVLKPFEIDELMATVKRVIEHA
jgi:two-component system chemotaxis response regulator CheY